MRLNDLARQMRVDVSDLLTMARDLGLDIKTDLSAVSAADEWTLRKTAAVPPQRSAPPNQRSTLSGFWTVPPRPVPRGRPRGPVTEPSDLAKVFLRWEEANTDTRLFDLPPRPVRIRHAEAMAREWAKHWFTAQEAEQWLNANGKIPADVAASLRDAGLTPEDAAMRIRTPRGFVHTLPLAIRVSSGELSPAEAAAELREMKA